MAQQQTRPTGASPGPTRRRRPLWLRVLLAVAIIVLLVLWLVRCGSGAGSDPAATGGSVVPSASAGAAAGAGTLTAGGATLLPLAAVAGPNGELTALAGRPVTGRSVPVRSVPSDEGFWVGSSDTDQVWVELTVPPGESPYQVRPGQLVDFTGPLTAHDAGFAGQVGVDPAEGADQLTRQAAHVAVQKADLRIVRG